MRVESGRKRGEGVKSYPKKWGKLFERYLDEYLPERKDEICARADREYRKQLTQMPDVGGKENIRAWPIILFAVHSAGGAAFLFLLSAHS